MISDLLLLETKNTGKSWKVQVWSSLRCSSGFRAPRLPGASRRSSWGMMHDDIHLYGNIIQIHTNICIYIYMWEGPSGLIRTNTYMCCNTWLITTKTNHGPSNKINPIIGPQMRYRNAKTPFLSVHWSFTISSILLS